MIRDEYNKKKQTTAKFSAKEERKKKEMGERNYYASQIPKITDMCKALSTSLLITLIFLSLAYAVILLSFIVLRNTETPYSTTKFIVYTSIFGALVVFYALWHLVIKPAQLRKAERYKAEIDRINAENLKKNELSLHAFAKGKRRKTGRKRNKRGGKRRQNVGKR